jgi:hypothetical protein
LTSTIKLGIEQIYIVDYTSLDLESIKKRLSNVVIKISDYSQPEKSVFDYE